MSRLLICIAGLCVAISPLAGQGLAGETVLPQGSAPPPIADGYFPNRLYEFVWRNWDLVDPKKLAKIVDASVEDVAAIAESMGLPPAAAVSPEMTTRGYVTLIRRNWHLLPYDQLLELLEMTPEQLAFTLRKDDYLWTKLGSLKPKCEPLRYAAPDEAAPVGRRRFGDWSNGSSATSCAARPSRDSILSGNSARCPGMWPSRPRPCHNCG